MSSSRFVVDEVVSPGTVRSRDQRLYVLRGIPDVEEDFVRFAEARALVEAELRGRELSYEEETAKELPDLPGMDIEAFDDRGAALLPGLAARVAGVLAGHPLN
ncbi:MAG: hypothetical protein JXA58_07335 [Dehalococcoidia bacterium]|nr:hypothetical protein [Dehalococcoidia bacterium]